MPRKGTRLSPEAAEKQAAAVRAWHEEHTEIVKFSIRVNKGCSGAFRELARRRGQSLTAIVRDYLKSQCEAEGIDV